MKLKLLFLLVFFSFSVSHSKETISENYSNIAYAKYKDSLDLAEVMLSKINYFLESPSEKNTMTLKRVG